MITRLLMLGDLHAGSKFGFLPAGYRDEDTGAPLVLGASQKLIWKQFKWIENNCLKDCDELVVVLMSDLVHGPSIDGPDEVITGDVKTQCQIAIHGLLPIVNKAKSSYVLDARSRFHADPGRFADDYIASELGAALGKRSHIRLDILIGGIHFRFQHHGPSLGYRPSTRGDVVRRFLRDSHVEALEFGEDTPDAWIWAHWHQHFSESLRVQTPKGAKDLRAYFTPPLTFPDKRTVRNIKRLERAHIGALALDIHDNGLIEEKLWFKSYSIRNVVKH